MGTGERDALRASVLEGRYRVGGLLGSGSAGLVFAGERLLDGADVAIKVLRPELSHQPDQVRRLRREARAGWEVRHPGIARTHDEGTLADGSPYVVFERVRGESLAHLLMRRPRLDPAEAALLLRRTAVVLQAVHAAGWVHRDVKPEHIWLEPAGASRLNVRLLDFGVCQPPDLEPERLAWEQGRVFGTPGYASPEQARGETRVGPSTDLYALGAVAFECCAGGPPFRDRNVAVVLRRVLEEDAPPLDRHVPGVSRELAALVARLLSRNPAERPPNCRALLRELEPLCVAAQEVERRLRTGLLRPGASGGDEAPADEAAPTRDLSRAAV